MESKVENGKRIRKVKWSGLPNIKVLDRVGGCENVYGKETH